MIVAYSSIVVIASDQIDHVRQHASCNQASMWHLGCTYNYVNAGQEKC